jgi:alpha-beta hydrolase superfamily lysophospholipase
MERDKMTENDADFSFLDTPEILRIGFYPRKSPMKPSKPNAKNYFVEVEKEVKIGCRFYTKGSDYPSLLYFHGNGEIVDDYDECSRFYNEIGINLFVADYRGYGFSDGTPTMTTLIRDAHKIFRRFCKIVEDGGFRKKFFVMGRSLGSIPAIEVVYHYQNDVQGLIVESGPANNLRQYIRHLVPSDHPFWNDDFPLLNKVRLRSISTPTLIIHGERDTGVPLKEGKELYENSAAKDKKLVIIPNADHNDLMIVGKKQYFKAVEEFVRTHV